MSNGYFTTRKRRKAQGGSMAFMERQIIRDEFVKIETNHGVTFVPIDVVGTLPDPLTQDALSDLAQYCEGIPESAEIISGFGARLSAPGYLDCTEWAVFDTEDEAVEYMDEYYSDESDEPDESDDVSYTECDENYC